MQFIGDAESNNSATIGEAEFCNKKPLAESARGNFLNCGESVSRVLSFKTVIYLNRASLRGFSHLLERCRANLAFLSGVAPSGVYSAVPSPDSG